MTHLKGERKKKGADNEGLLLTHQGSSTFLSLQQQAGSQMSALLVWFNQELPACRSECEPAHHRKCSEDRFLTDNNDRHFHIRTLYNIKTKAYCSISHLPQALTWCSFITVKQAISARMFQWYKRTSLRLFKLHSFNTGKAEIFKIKYRLRQITQIIGPTVQIAPLLASLWLSIFQFLFRLLKICSPWWMWFQVWWSARNTKIQVQQEQLV